MKLSIIIPAYNVEQYLERCINSCEHQDIPHNDYEVIIVNDGSTDNTLQVAQQSAEKHDNIIVRSQENQGQSIARNIGIDIAKGEYIWFIDSDDFIDENCVKGLLEKIENYDLDVLLFYLKIAKEDYSLKREVAKQPVPTNKILKQGELLYHGFMPGTICGSIFKTSLIVNNGLKFVPHLIHQDSEFAYRSFALAQRTMFIKDAPYCYYIHGDSTLTETNLAKVAKREVDNARIAHMIHDFAIEQQVKGMDEKLVSHLLERSRSLHFGALYSLWRKRKQWKSNGVNAIIIEQLKELGLYPLMAPYNSWKQRLAAKILINNSFLYC